MSNTAMKEICVLGLGYIGLPTASILATQGHKVLGVDVSQYVVETINDGDVHVEEPGLKTVMQAAIHSGNLRAALKPAQADVFIIAVPTPFTDEKTANLSYIESAARSLNPFLKKGDLVILESTVPPGTTQNVLAPVLNESGFRVGEDLFVAHCPERVLPGKILKELIGNDRVIGGVNAESTEKAAELYRGFVEGQIFLTNSATAEMAKITENIYRDVNIALANELAIICEKLSICVWDVIEFSNRHPRVNVHTPGPGVGGHCISVDPWFLISEFPDDARLIKMSRSINDSMPEVVVQKVNEATKGNDDANITLLGLAYKGNIDDTRESPSEDIYAGLRESGRNVRVYDPHVRKSDIDLSDLTAAFTDSDCVVVATDHDEFKYLDPSEVGKLVRSKVIIDTRCCLNGERWSSAGFDYRLLGQGRTS